MTRARASPQETPFSPTCVWMDAGAVAFKLCDRGFDCEHCPFDCAMRGCPIADGGHHGEADAPWHFPVDRSYTPGHMWVQVVEPGLVRTGIDVLAARLLAPVHGIVCSPPHLCRDDSRGAWCEIESIGGSVPLALPVPGMVARWNPGVLALPALLAADPYGSGWIAEISTNVEPPGAGLCSWRQAVERAAHDANFLRHQIAFHLLSATDPGHVPLGSGLVETGRELLEPGPFVALARQILH